MVTYSVIMIYDLHSTYVDIRHLRKIYAETRLDNIYLLKNREEIFLLPPNPPLDDMGPVSIPLPPVAPMGMLWGGCE